MSPSFPRTTESDDASFVVYDEGPIQHRILADAITELATADVPVRVLEAGCGQTWPLDLDVDLHITGVDLDAEAMRIRHELHDDLDVAVVGDLRTVELPGESFDAVYCSFVLEHIDGAEHVLDRLVAATRPGGRLIFRIPDGKSLYGFVVRHTPFNLHVWTRRYLLRDLHAGEPGHSPYPTYYDPVVSLPGMRDYAERNGLRVVTIFGSNQYLKFYFGPARRPIGWALERIGRLTGGRLRGTHNNLVVIFERPAASADAGS